MCGIIGFIQKEYSENLGETAYISLEMLQHRGQDACGVYWTDFKKSKIIKEQGSVDTVLNKKNIKKINGTLFIGQTRYPTTKSKEESQPLHTPFGDIAMVHNGHIYNDEEIREEFKKKGIHFTTGIDLESILTIFGYSYIKTAQSEKNIYECISKSVDEIIKKTRGGYSIIASISKKYLIAFKDPYGIRPLFYGKKNSARAFSSETIALEKLGFDYDELKPGEIIIVDENLVETRIQKQNQCEKFCSFEVVYFSRASSKYKGIQIFTYRRKLGEKLAKIFEKAHPEFSFENTLIAPVPETSRAAAEGFSQYFSLKNKRAFLSEVLEKHRYGGRNFIKPSEEIRKREVFYTLTPVIENTQGKKIILIDDSIVRGTTSKRMVQSLRESGAKEIHLCITFPPIRYSCFYGIDTPTREELIAYNKTVEEIAKYLNVDSLTYMTEEGLKEIVGENVCIACVKGDYVNL